MIKRILFAFALLIGCRLMQAAYIIDKPVQLVQPDGTVMDCFASGDEYYNWLHDAAHYTIIQNPTTGYYCYAVLDGDAVVASEYIVGSVNPATLGIPAGVSISAEAKRAIRNNFLKNVPDKTTLPEYRTPKGPKNIGRINNLVIYIRFSDQQEFTEDTLYYWSMFNDVSNLNNQSMRNYFREVSYNQLEINTYFYPFTFQNTVVSFQDEHPRAYYMPYSMNNPMGYNGDGERADREFQLLADAVATVGEQIPEDLDIDYNNDGLVDNVCFIIKGGTTAWSTLLWPHRWILYGRDAYIHGKRVWDFNFQLSNDLSGDGASVLCHEMFHSLGAPDLYRYVDNTIDPIGGWDVMCANARPAQSMSAYMKWRYGGWIAQIPEITEGGIYTINNVWQPENCIYKIASPNNTQEYFVVEFRNRAAHPYDNKLPGNGLLIYRINPNVEGNADGPPDEVYLYRPGGNNTYTQGNLNAAAFSATSGRTTFNDETDPPCFLSDNTPGGLHIRNISEVGEQMTFEVVLSTLPEADFTASQEVVTVQCPVDFEATSFNPVDTWFWEFEDGMPATSTEQNPTGIVFTTTGEKRVSLTVSNNYGSTTNTKQNFINVSGTLAPSPDFYAYGDAACVGTPIRLFDNSTLCPTGWQWSFNPADVIFVEGTNEFSQNPVVQMSSINRYSVTLTVTNSNGSSTLTKNDFISTIGSQPTNCNINFSDVESLEERGWHIENPDDDQIFWELYTIDANTKAARINYFNSILYLKSDLLVTPVMNFDAPYKMHFKYAYALQYNYSNYSDSLFIAVSTDCGNTWTREATFVENGSNNFVTAPVINARFVPAGNQWCDNNIYNTPCPVVDLTKYAGTPSLMVAFEAVRVAGNNLYISEVSFEDATAINEPTATENYLITPNPTHNTFTIQSTQNTENGTVEVYDMLGKHLLTTPLQPNATTINLEHCKSGIFIVVITAGDERTQMKVVKF